MQHITIGGTSYAVLRELSGGSFHDSMQLKQEGSKILLKLYKSDYTSEIEQQWERWRSTGSSISGPHLIGYLEVGTHEGRPFVLREWIEGEAFDAFARRMKVDGPRLAEALAVGQALCRAVAPLHDAGLFHGHIHNANMLFDQEDNPMVVDPWLGTPTAMTAHLAIEKPGSQGALAPEQRRVGGKIDARTDVWQLGLLLARLYSRKPDIVVNQRILMELHGAKLPLPLIKVLWQAVQEEPADRFPDAGTRALALAEVTLAEHQRTVYVRPLPPARGVQDRVSPVLRNTALGLFAIGGVILGGWAFQVDSTRDASASASTDAGVLASAAPARDSGPATGESTWSFPLSADEQLELIRVEAGTYTRGSSPEQFGVAVQELGLDAEAGKREMLAHQVAVTRPFFIGTTEVTVGQFAAFVEATGYTTTAEREGYAYIWRGDDYSRSAGSWRSPGYPQTERHPVVCVSWYDAQAFVDWLNTRSDNITFSLPTEAEFEMALRAGSDTQFYWGDRPEAVDGRENVKDASGLSIFGWEPSFTLDDGHAWPASVGTYRPNTLGLYDMAGNVFEWCADWYAGYSSSEEMDPQGPAIGNERVYRGGGWRSAVAAHRSAARWGYDPINRSNTLGFRVVARPKSEGAPLGAAAHGVRTGDVRVGPGALLEPGTHVTLRILKQRVFNQDQTFKDWNGVADLTIRLPVDRSVESPFLMSLSGMREGGLRQISISSPASDELSGIRGGAAVTLPRGTTWHFEVEAVSSTPAARSRVGLDVDVESTLVGALVRSIVAAPAQAAGVQGGDLITAIDGTEVGSGRHAVQLLRGKVPGEPVELEVTRSGERLSLTVVPQAVASSAPEAATFQGAPWVGGDM
ncbi:MAG: SUMF1/EgtB/PvdO family nonheme iron enzyme [Sumerlaeia bacterium]